MPSYSTKILQYAIKSQWQQALPELHCASTASYLTPLIIMLTSFIALQYYIFRINQTMPHLILNLVYQAIIGVLNR